MCDIDVLNMEKYRLRHEKASALEGELDLHCFDI